MIGRGDKGGLGKFKNPEEYKSKFGLLVSNMQASKSPNSGSLFLSPPSPFNWHGQGDCLMTNG